MYMVPLLERLRAHLDRARLFPAPGPAVLAVSGGLDSVALLDLMHSVAPERGLLLVVAHADDGIQLASGSTAISVILADIVTVVDPAFYVRWPPETRRSNETALGGEESCGEEGQ